MVALDLPLLRPDQFAIARHPARFKVLAMGRRWGKTVMSGVCAINAARQGGKALWMSYDHTNNRLVLRWAIPVIWPIIREGRATLNRTEKIIVFSNGGILQFLSGENADAARGSDWDFIVLDEAAKLSDYVWDSVLRPTLADRQGSIMLISSPQGKNWFFHLYNRGQDPKYPNWKSWTAPTSDNPIPAIRADMEIARKESHPDKFREEWEAAFLDDGGAVFRRVKDCAIAVRQDGPIAGHSYMLSIDLAKSVDFTVAIVWDLSLRQAVNIDRFNGVEYMLQVARIKALSQRFNNALVIAEENANETTIEYMRREGLSVQAFRTTNATKSAIIEGLAVALETEAIGYPNDPVLIGELEAYSSERLPSGLMRYGAPQGLHDDCVMSLAIGWQGTNRDIGI